MNQLINLALDQMAAARPVFHSEADLQHALAWQIKELAPDVGIRLEVPFVQESKRRYVDLVAKHQERKFFIELKYKTWQAVYSHGGEDFHLKNQGVNDQGAYDIIKDIQRIEWLTSSCEGSEGFVIVVSNDPRYWSSRKNAGRTTIDEQFKLTEGRTLAGELSWHPSVGNGSIKDREASLRLSGTYEVRWVPYASLPGLFKALVFHVVKNHAIQTRQHLTPPKIEMPAPSVVTRDSSCSPEKRQPNWQLVLQTLQNLGGVASLARIRERFASEHPDRKAINVRHELVLMAVNHPKRIHYPQAQKPRRSNSGHPLDRLFLRSDDCYELYSPESHGVWEIHNGSAGRPEVRQVSL